MIQSTSKSTSSSSSSLLRLLLNSTIPSLASLFCVLLLALSPTIETEAFTIQTAPALTTTSRQLQVPWIETGRSLLVLKLANRGIEDKETKDVIGKKKQDKKADGSNKHDADDDENDDDDNNVDSLYSMPWSTMQEFVLQDKISTYLIHIPQRLNNPTLQGGGIHKTTFCLWHSLRKDVTELMGYEISFLQKKYQNLQDCREEDDNDVQVQPPGILPYIDEFEFRKNGGIKGRIYGLVGIEPGTQIVTSPLKEVEVTLPKGFVLTDDGSCAYELGMPKSEIMSGNVNKLTEFYKNKDARDVAGNNDDDGDDDLLYSMDLGALTKNGSKIVSNVSQRSGKVAGNVVSELSDPETSQMIVNLGATTAVVLGAATAMNMLSHHLTVNVFWV